MSISNLEALYIDQLQDLRSANKQSTEVTKELLNAASNSELREALERGIEGLNDGQAQVEAMIKEHGAKIDGEHCKGMEGLVNEARAHAIEESFGDDDTRDAMIITQYQRMVHYAIAGYGCLVAFANRLEMPEQGETLQKCLDACYDGDRTMSAIATSGVNESAV